MTATERRQTKGLMSNTIAVHVRFESLYISLSSSSNQQRELTKGHVTRSNFSCNLQRNKRCVASCKKKFTCNTPFCNCNCCVASCKKSRKILYFLQRCETSCLRVTSPLQLATQFLSEWANQSSSFVSAILFVIVRVASCEKSCKRVTPPLQLERFFIRHRCVASCKKNCVV